MENIYQVSYRRAINENDDTRIFRIVKAPDIASVYVFVMSEIIGNDPTWFLTHTEHRETIAELGFISNSVGIQQFKMPGEIHDEQMNAGNYIFADLEIALGNIGTKMYLSEPVELTIEFNWDSVETELHETDISHKILEIEQVDAECIQIAKDIFRDDLEENGHEHN